MVFVIVCVYCLIRIDLPLSCVALTAVRVTRNGVVDSHVAHTGSSEGAAFNHDVAMRVGTAGQVDQFRRHELLVPRDALFGSLVLNNV